MVKSVVYIKAFYRLLGKFFIIQHKQLEREREKTKGKVMVLPLSLLRTAQNHPMLVELKNGETYNGHLQSCDNWMNIHLREVICTSRDGDKFWKMPEVYIRGATIKYLRIPDDVLDQVKEDIKEGRKAARENVKTKKAFGSQNRQQNKPPGGAKVPRGGGIAGQKRK